MKNHYIPEFYTKLWAHNNKIVLYNRPRGKVLAREKYPSEVGFGRDIYTLPGIEDATRYHLEKNFFRDIDQKACDIARKLLNVNTSDLNAEQRADWVIFLISLRQRNPQKMIEIAAQAERAFAQNIDDYKTRYEAQQTDPRTFEEFI